MTLYNITDMQTLYRTLDACEADVDWIGMDGAAYSWRRFGPMLRSLPMREAAQVEIITHCARDAQRMIRYLIDRRDQRISA